MCCSGICKKCNNKLQLLQVTEDEFNSIKKEFFENVIIGKNVFSKTNPKEIEHFKKFVSNMGKFDVVVDGLNVAYSTGSKSPSVMSSLVCLLFIYLLNIYKQKSPLWIEVKYKCK